MKKSVFSKGIFTMVALVAISVFGSCTKKDSKPDVITDPGTHHIDAKFVGKWLWTESSDIGYYDDNGVFTGNGYGLATQYNIQANGLGTCFNHIYSTIGAGTGLEVNISYQGFFESDDEGHLGFFPTSGTYKSSSGENRALRPDELWNANTGTGATLYQQVTVTTQGGKTCFKTTASNGTVDTFFKMQ